MALSIKDPETDELARRLADRTGESLTDAVKQALLFKGNDFRHTDLQVVETKDS